MSDLYWFDGLPVLVAVTGDTYWLDGLPVIGDGTLSGGGGSGVSLAVFIHHYKQQGIM